MNVRRNDGLSATKAIFPMIGSIMGAGVLALPTSVESSGYLLSGPILFFIVSMSAFTLFQLVHCAKQLNEKTPSYFLVCKNASPILGYIAEASIGIQGFGSCLCYFLILYTWTTKILGIDTLLKESIFYKVLFSAALIAIPLLLSLQKDLSKLSNTSLLGIISVIYLSLLVCACGVLSFVLPIPAGVKADEPLKAYETDFLMLFNALSVYIFATGCQQNMVKIFSMLKKKTVANGAKVGVGAVGIAAVIFFLVSNGGYIAGGNNQKGSILDVLEDKERVFYAQITNYFGKGFFHAITLAKLGMTIVLISGYPLQMHPTRDALLTFMGLAVSKDKIERNKRAFEMGSILFMSACIFLLSFTNIPYLYVMNIVASTASCYIIYVLPSIAYLASEKKKRCFTMISTGIMITGMLISLISVYRIVYPNK